MATGTIPSMESSHAQLKDNTVIVGELQKIADALDFVDESGD
jgi:hypothetical protein